MLHAVAELPQHTIRHIARILRNKIDPHTFRADQPRDLLHLIDQRFGRIIEQQMRLIEEEDESRFIGVPDLGQLLEQFREQPQKEGRVEPRARHQTIRRHHIDPATAIGRERHQICQIQRGLTEEIGPALILQHQKLPLDRADGRAGHIAVAQGNLILMLAHKQQHGLQIFEIEKRQALLIRDPERDIQHAFLRLGQIHQSRQQQRPHLRNRGADRMAFLAKHIPEGDGKRAVVEIIADRLGACQERRMQLALRRARQSHPREIALHICHEHGHASG